MKALSQTIKAVAIAIALLIAPGTASGDWTPPSYVFAPNNPFFLPAPTANNNTGWQIKNFGPVGIGIKIKSPGWTMEITNVEAGSPAASTGMLAAGQIIESINGVTLTGVDPRVVLGKLITDAEASNGIISLQIQNVGPVVVTIPVMGSYSATWPLNCPKSDLIVRNLANRLAAQGQNEWGSVLFLLSTGDANDLAVVRGWMQNRASFAVNTWSIGYEGIGVAEYYLRTGDPVVLPLMQEAADKLRDTIYAGGWAGRSGSFTYNSGGHLNAAGVPALTFLLLAKTCGINVDSATLESSLRHFYRFSGTGGVPYGDYTPKPGFSDDNGKTGNLALAMAAASRLTPNGENSVYAQAAQRCATKFFYGMNDYGQGHTGGGIGEIWKSVSMGLMTEKLPAQYRSFMDSRWWILELSRRHNGGIGIAGGPESNYDKATGETQNGWGTLYALSYTLPRKHLHLFGAPLSPWAQSFTLPARPWGTAADDAFRSFDPVPGGPWTHQDMLNEVPNLHSGKAVSTLMGSTTSDQDILTYLHHPELTYRNDAIGAILRLGKDSMLSYMINSADARLQHIGVMALHEILGTWRTTYKNPSKVTPAMWARIDQLVRDPQTSWFVKQWALGLLQHVDTATLKTYTSLFVTLADHEEYWLRGQASGNSPRLIADPETYATIFPPVLNAAVDAVPYFEVTGVSALKTGLDAASSEIKNDALQMLMLSYTNLPQDLVSERGIYVVPDGGEIKRKSFGQVFGFSAEGQLFVNTRPKKTSAWKVSGDADDLYVWDGNFQTNSAFHGKWKFINSHNKVKDEAAALALIHQQLAANQVPLSTDTSIGFYGFTVGASGVVNPSGLGNWPNPMRYSGNMVFGTYIDRAYQYKILTVYGRKYLMMEIEFIADADPTIEGGAGPELDPTYQTSYMVYTNIDTADTIPPEIITLSPANNATGVAVGANLVATFSESIVRGTGDITLINTTDGTQSTIAVTDTNQVSISGRVMTINPNPTADLPVGKNFAVRIAATAVKDLANNAFAGIADNTTWSFATAATDTSPPTISTLSPADSATGVAVGANLVATFGENIARGTGNITVKNMSDGSSITIPVTDTAQVSVSGAVLTINPTVNLAANKNYAVRIAAAAVKDLANNAFAGIANDTTWNFATVTADTIAPTISSLNPADNATGVAVGANLVATFSESIAIVTGNITIHPIDNSGDMVIAITDASQVTVSGTTLTINPTANLSPSKQYAVQIDATAIDDLAGNSYAGITDDSTWSFTTASPDLTPPSPDPMSFAVQPIAQGETTISMTATTATDPGGVEYLFECSVGGPNSDWQSSSVFTATGLNHSTTYTYTVKARDAALNQTAPSAPASATTATPDTTPPASSSLSPANAATSVPLSTTLTITFSESVKKGSGNIVIRNTGGTTVESVPVSDARVVISGSTATITPAASLPSARTLYVEIDNGAILDLANNPFAGISGSSTWTFTTAVPGAVTTLLDEGFESPVYAGGASMVNGSYGTNFFVGTGTGVPGTVKSRNPVNSDDVPGTYVAGNSNASNHVLQMEYNSPTTESGEFYINIPTHTWSAGQTYTLTLNASPQSWNGNIQRYIRPSLRQQDKTVLWTVGANASTTVPLYNNFGRQAWTAAQTFSWTFSSDAFTGGTQGSLIQVHLDSSGQRGLFVDNVKLTVSTSSGGAGPGPVASFAISPIASPQKIGTPITGITLTAKDAANATATGFTGTVTFGGTGGFTGTSANFVAGELTGVSVTPTVAGSNLTFTVNDGAGHTGSTTITTIQTQYQIWAVGGVAFDADTNGDGVKNGMAWLLGAGNASGNASGLLPKASINGGNLRLTFRCLKSTKRGGMVLKVQSSSDLGASDPWTSHEAAVPDADGTVNGVVFDTTDDGDFINVIADIPAAGANGFGRLQATP